MKNKIVIAGATGFIGQLLTKTLADRKFEIVALSRQPQRYRTLFNNNVNIASWDARTAEGWWELADGAFAFINLAGENIGSGLWTENKKQRLIESRLHTGRAMTEAFKKVQEKPHLLIQASAIGFYGDGGEQILNEEFPAGKGFLSNLTQKWESSFEEIDHSDTRKVIFRIGLVLGRGGGLLSKMSIPFRLFFGGHFGDGEQWMSWIHLQDVCGAVLHALENDTLNGVYNLTAPSPVQAQQFYKLLGRSIHRPSWFHIPGKILRGLLGEMASETLLVSQKVSSQKLENTGYNFEFSDLETAFDDLVGKPRQSS
ncbi:MAG: TIGR01777 family oxidoreductase [bacterium]|nr:MAG: TIGR01777 family oxidoreductase [bacterium]